MSINNNKLSVFKKVSQSGFEPRSTSHGRQPGNQIDHYTIKDSDCNSRVFNFNTNALLTSWQVSYFSFYLLLGP